MRKTLLSALVAGAFAVGGSAYAGPLTFNLDGAGNVIVANSLDWAATSFLAKGGVAAITAFDAGATGSALNFDVLTHAKLTGYVDANNVSVPGLPAGFAGEITVVASFQEKVVAVAGNQADFQTTGAGWVEMYYSATPNSDSLRGSNFNDGRLIMRANGVSDSGGLFRVTNSTGVNLDGAGAQDYAGQLTVSGFGIQDEVRFGTDSIFLDSNFLQSTVIDFSMLFENISIGLPYRSVNPSDCFNENQGAAADGSITNHTASGLVSQCNAFVSALDPHHVNGTYADNVIADGNDGGYVPIVGTTNGLFSTSPDFVAQTDFNSAVTGAVPEPGMLALLGLAFAGLGVTSVRRRRS